MAADLARQPQTTADMLGRTRLGHLLLPLPHEPCHACAADRAGTSCRGPIEITPPSPAHASDNELAGYRWILGHHASFCAWRFCADALRRSLRGSGVDLDWLARAIAAYDAYSALLLYAGSCTRTTYLTWIRPPMMAADPAFSGRWQRDFEPLPPLLRQVRVRLSGPSADHLVRAARDNQLVHIAMARKLVPDGESLLQQSDRQVNAPVTDAERDLVDSFFLVRREPICHHSFQAQLSATVTAVLVDLAYRPLPALEVADIGLPAPALAAVSRTAANSANAIERLLDLASVPPHLVAAPRRLPAAV